MKIPKNELGKLFAKAALLPIADILHCVCVLFCSYWITYGRVDDYEELEKFLLLELMTISYIAVFVWHLHVYKNIMPFEKKGYKIAYWVISVLFMNPYFWYSILGAVLEMH